MPRGCPKCNKYALVTTRSGREWVCTGLTCDYVEAVVGAPVAPVLAATANPNEAAELAASKKRAQQRAAEGGLIDLQGTTKSIADAQAAAKKEAVNAGDEEHAALERMIVDDSKEKKNMPKKTIAPKTTKASPAPEKTVNTPAGFKRAVAEVATRTIEAAPAKKRKASDPTFKEEFATELCRMGRRIRYYADAFTLNEHPRVKHVVSELEDAAQRVEAAILELVAWQDNFEGRWPVAAAREAACGARGLTDGAAIVLRFAVERETFSLVDLAEHFVAHVELPKKWTFVASVAPDQRRMWLSRQKSYAALAQLLKRDAVQKIRTGIYSVTPTGVGLAGGAPATSQTPKARTATVVAPSAETTPTAAPANAKGKKTKPTADAFAAGAKVRLAGDAPASFRKLATKDELDNLTVRGKTGKDRIDVQAGTNGIRLSINRAHLEAV